MIDQKPRRILGPHRTVAAAPRDGVERVAHPGRGQQAVDHLDHLEERHRVEEMPARDALRPPAIGGDRRHGERRGVGGENAIVGDDGFEVGEQPLLGLDLLDDRFDHDIGARHGIEPVDDREPTDRRLRRALGHAALFRRPAQHPRDEGGGLFRRAAARVVQPDRDAARRRDLGDAPAHRAGADDAEREIGRLRIDRHAVLPTNAGNPGRASP